MSIGTIILIVLIIVLLGGFGGIGGRPFYGAGYYGGGGPGLVTSFSLSLFCSEEFDAARTFPSGR